MRLGCFCRHHVAVEVETLAGRIVHVARLALRFHHLREAEMCLFPGAEATLDRSKELGLKLALISNGAALPCLSFYSLR
jgi:hypothetical protein